MKLKSALFLDAYCPSHVGNDVLLESSTLLLKRLCQNVEIKIHAKTPESFVSTQGVACSGLLFPDAPVGEKFLTKIMWLIDAMVFMAIQIINALTLRIPPYFLTFSTTRKKALRDITESSFAISIGGEMINDSFRKTLPLYLFEFWLAARFGSKVVIFPQSIGPLRRKWTRWMTAMVLRQCTIVTARDQPSLDELHSLGLSGNQALTAPDVGIEQPRASIAEAKLYLADLGVDFQDRRIWIGLTPSAWVEEGVAKQDYLEIIAKAIKQLSTDHRLGVILMPANMPVCGERTSDYETATRLFDMLSDACPCHILPKAVVPARLFKGIQGCLDMVISTRMHASILSTMAATPTITINTQRKLYGYMSRIGQERFSLAIQNLTATQIAQAAEEIINNQTTVRKELKNGYAKVSAELTSYVAMVQPILDCAD
ncbi:polysaccharide pyruvyl transferase family protein [Rhodoferax sp.]|uniref:polysaccharide pyruvyl transferase family protein n=1 Tax=Rhodoferax sp. TaxID=50421 RepID=UPI00262D9BBF|nr:polysaccharide pyruvyl transferase family protein [Rhodoferax sp.]MDD3934906.1 polysaccharide pyruvyl transferase family protein [Rhodoferax sp.]